MKKLFFITILTVISFQGFAKEVCNEVYIKTETYIEHVYFDENPLVEMEDMGKNLFKITAYDTTELNLFIETLNGDKEMNLEINKFCKQKLIVKI
jgi:hypothetical protein